MTNAGTQASSRILAGDITLESLSANFPDKTVRNLKLIDYNNKKYNKVFLEINLAPARALPERELSETIFLVSWGDNDQQSVVEVIDLIRLPLKRLTSAVTYVSHGMDAVTFKNWWGGIHPGSDDETEMAIYIYSAIQ